MSAAVAVRAVVARARRASVGLPRLRRGRSVSWCLSHTTPRVVWCPSAAPISASAAPNALSIDPLDERFNTTLLVLAVRAPRRDIGSLMPLLKKHTLGRPRTHKVVHLGDGDGGDGDAICLILLDEKTCAPGSPVEALPESVQQVLSFRGSDGSDGGDGRTDGGNDDGTKNTGSPKNNSNTKVTLTTHALSLTYANLSAEEALAVALPSFVTVPTGFETAGTIAHLNLRPEHTQHKHVIGQVLLDKLPSIKTVVTKVGETGGPFRTFAMEVIAGEGGALHGALVTRVAENGLTFVLDFRNMYWNSRLGTERARLINSFSEHDIVLDLCAGVGPIALPALQKTKAVYANDLNPDAVFYLKMNDKQNKKANGGKRLAGVFNENATDCVSRMVRGVGGAFGGDAQEDSDAKGMSKQSKKGGGAQNTLPRFTQAVMNLPEGGVDLLTCFVGVFRKAAWPPETLPRINVYAFSKSNDPELDVATRAAAALGLGANPGALGDTKSVTTRRVRHVAPGKYMLLLSFTLPGKAAYGEKGGV